MHTVGAPQSLAHFKRHGWQILRDVIPLDIVQETASFLETSYKKLLPELQRKGLRLDAVRESVGELLQDSNLDPEFRKILIGLFPIDVKMSPNLRLLLRSPGLIAALCEALGSEHLRMHMPPSARYILPKNTFAGVPPHQDVLYDGFASDTTTLWVPYVAIDEQCGGVAFYPSDEPPAKKPLMPASETGWQPAVCTEGLTKVTATPLALGDALIFTRWIVHESVPNISDHTRLSVDYRFFTERDTSTKHYLNLDDHTVVAP